MPRTVWTTACLAAALAAIVAARGARALAGPDEAAPAAPVADPTERRGADLSALTDAQRAVARAVLSSEFCHCGCPHTLDGCLREHAGCHHAPRTARLVVELAAQSLSADDVRKALRDYYSGFDRVKRAHLDVKDFGPPLGDPAAPVTIVEFSDFTCPFCQRMRPELDRYVRENEHRVRLFYKPFPIASHEHSMEAALAGEWARDRGLFWKMYDQLFEHPHNLGANDLAGYATAIGGDPEDLRKALEAGRNKERIRGSQAEGRAAKMTGTPTLYLNGHKLDLPYGADLRDTLDFAVEDEEEWAKHGGWERD